VYGWALLLVLRVPFGYRTGALKQGTMSFFEQTATTPAASGSEPGQEISLGKYTGKVVLVENVATL